MAELTEARRKTLLAYCVIDDPGEGDDALLRMLYDDAIGYLARAGVSEPKEGTDRRGSYDLCVNYLVNDAYSRRDMAITGAKTGASVAENPRYRQLLNQLKWTEPVSVAEQGNDTAADAVPELGTWT